MVLTSYGIYTDEDLGKETVCEVYRYRGIQMNDKDKRERDKAETGWGRVRGSDGWMGWIG